MAKKFTSMAGMTGNYRIILVDQEPFEVRVIGADILRWEQTNSGKSFFEGEISFSRLAFAAWAACKRNDLTSLIFADFMKTLVDLESEEDEPEPEAGVDEEGGGVDLPDPSEGDTTAW